MTQLIIYLVIAVVILSIFNSVLGKPLGKMPDKDSTQKKPAEPEKQEKVLRGPASESLMRIAERDPDFDVTSFLHGAETAYKWIVTAFIEGNTDRLKKLVTQDVFDLYHKEIQKRKKNYSVKLEKLDILSADIDRADIKENIARISVRYKAIMKTREGTEEKLCLEDTEEVWEFKREISSSDPNWILSAVSHDF